MNELKLEVRKILIKYASAQLTIDQATDEIVEIMKEIIPEAENNKNIHYKYRGGFNQCRSDILANLSGGKR